MQNMYTKIFCTLIQLNQALIPNKLGSATGILFLHSNMFRATLFERHIPKYFKNSIILHGLQYTQYSTPYIFKPLVSVSMISDACLFPPKEISYLTSWRDLSLCVIHLVLIKNIPFTTLLLTKNVLVNLLKIFFMHAIPITSCIINLTISKIRFLIRKICYAQKSRNRGILSFPLQCLNKRN